MVTKMFKLIVCVNKKLVIGNNNELLYHIPNDLGNFKRLTIDNIIIMGKKTLESLPGGKPLPNRINIVLTRDKHFNMDGVIVAHSIEDVIEICNETSFQNKEKFIVGGGSIYKQFIEKDLVNEIYMTEVNDENDGDTIFPELNKDVYKTTFQTEWYPISNIGCEYRYKILKSKS